MHDVIRVVKQEVLLLFGFRYVINKTTTFWVLRFASTECQVLRLYFLEVVTFDTLPERTIVEVFTATTSSQP